MLRPTKAAAAAYRYFEAFCWRSSHPPNDEAPVFIEISPDEKLAMVATFLLVPDLGAGRSAHVQSGQESNAQANQAIPVKEGCGPASLRPRESKVLRFYLLCELSSDLLLIETDLKRLERLSNSEFLPTEQARYIPTGGKGPRHFSFSPDPEASMVVVSNQEATSSTFTRRDPTTGALTLLKTQVEYKSPAVALFRA
ncbi:hypothetical protein H4Q26_005136 [Puccinia striiformis f. sp. tritici PST-130]|nr:hypothetical protein H4Q26_005136 [Puccinia striiformis f. sp. tritici PST-130]